ncbi:hypothetical protein BGW39_003814, partial [Mortierella sp. 14UC]
VGEQLELFDKFVEQWLKINTKRLTTVKLSDDARRLLDDLMDGGFNEATIEFLQNLAAAIYKYQGGKPDVQYIPGTEKDTWKVDFFAPDMDIVFFRECSPLTRVDIRHRFIRRSLLEYFYSFHQPRTTQPKFAFKETSLTHWRPDSYKPPDSNDTESQDHSGRRPSPPSALSAQKVSVFSNLTNNTPSETAS